MVPAICALLAAALAAAPSGDPPRGARRAAPPAAHAIATQRPGPGKGKPVRGNSGSALDRARAQLAEVKRDPAQRRYRHRWEKAIAALERAARGRDTGPGLLDAARGRYALYRFSQVEADRDAALALARRADRVGAREGAALARAIRKEMGEEDAPPARQRTPASAAWTHRPSAPATRTPPRAQATDGRDREHAAAPPRGGVADGARAAGAAAPPRARPAAAPDPRPSAIGETSAAGRPSPTEPDVDADQEPAVDDALEKALAEDGAAEPGESATPAPARVSDVKSWSNHDYTRVAVYLSRSVAFTREDLPAAGGQPRRVALDLRPAAVARALTREVGDALVTRVRTAQLDDHTVRVVLDLAGEEELTVFALQDPPRLILDVGSVAPERAPEVATASPSSAGEAGATTGAGPDPVTRRGPSAAPPRAVERGPTPAPDAPEMLARGPIRRIIVDAGHGGHDTGAIGPTRVREKDVTLAMARRLARQLEGRGFEVVLTRTDDRYVALEERTAIANARHGDLFVSLHANAHPRRDRRGVETYVLNVADDRYAARLAARENGALGDGAADIPVLRRILSDLDAKMSAEASRRLARAVQRELCGGIRGRIGDVRDLGVKSALFYVLLGARMPAVLVETGFISNRVEENRLRTPAFQDEVASAVVRAVEGFASREARVASVR